MPYIGYYINLDRSPDRRAAMEVQLARLNPPARYRRVPAVDGNPHGVASARLSDAEIGCLTSHYLLPRMHRDGDSHLHVIEDDAVLANRSVQFVEQIIAMGLLDDIDVLFTSTVLSEKFDAFRDLFGETRKAWRTNLTRAEDGTAIDVQFGFVPYLAGMGPTW
jgi:GR25 family glycosyltransferase involved in LPS biosynthesis